MRIQSVELFERLCLDFLFISSSDYRIVAFDADCNSKLPIIPSKGLKLKLYVLS